MAIDRPTFHESWYRVADLAPRLLTDVNVYRQHFRGQLWYVLENSSNNQFSRITPAAWRFIGLLDGRRTVVQAWRICSEQLGDDAPTQGEVIQLLGQLYTMNLLYADLPADSRNLLDRYSKRVRRQVQGFVTNILFVRIPLIDPDRFLNNWVGLFGLAFTKIGFLIWLAVISTGLYFGISNAGELVAQSRDVLNPGNFIYLYLTLAVIKVFHEFSHAFACKKFGKHNPNGGQVHTMGVMFLVFMPLPYVDASSAWAFRKKYHRVILGMAGVAAELLCAAVAAIVWANTSTGTIHIIAYNVIFVASVSTIIFNGNPLLRFDAYYTLADLIEAPNLSQRSRNYLYYLVKHYCWGIKKTFNPAHTLGDRLWFFFYGIASTVYRVFISIRILLFLNRRLPEELFIIVPILALSAIIMWVCVPVGRFIHFLAVGPELARTRTRGITTTVAFLITLVAVIGIIPFTSHIRIEGIVEPVTLAIVHTQTDGFVAGMQSSPRPVTADGETLISLTNPQLQAQIKILDSEKVRLQAKWRQAQMQEPAAAQIIRDQILALEEKIDRVRFEIASLNLRPPVSGTWVCPNIDNTRGVYLRKGQQVGFVGSLEDVRIRATARQSVAAILIEQPPLGMEIRPEKRPDITFSGTIETIYPAGQEVLPSEALGYAAGGSMPTDLRDPRRPVAAEKFFEVRIHPHQHPSLPLRTGQRVIARIRLPNQPLALQWWRTGRQLFQRRFHI
jgi:putative peptide zinc metalloprotease protein